MAGDCFSPTHGVGALKSKFVLRLGANDRIAAGTTRIDRPCEAGDFMISIGPPFEPCFNFVGWSIGEQSRATARSQKPPSLLVRLLVLRLRDRFAFVGGKLPFRGAFRLIDHQASIGELVDSEPPSAAGQRKIDQFGEAIRLLGDRLGQQNQCFDRLRKSAQ